MKSACVGVLSIIELKMHGEKLKMENQRECFCDTTSAYFPARKVKYHNTVHFFVFTK